MNTSRTLSAARLADWTDAELIGSYAASRAEDVLAEIIRRHGRMVHSICLRTLGEAHSAEDAAQVTFFLFSRKAGTVRSRGTPLAAWLCRAARLAALKSRERRMTRERHEEMAGRGQVAMNPNSDGQEAAQLVREHLDEGLEKLPAKLREAVTLRYLAGLSQEETARELGCRVSAASMRISRGLERLRNYLPPGAEAHSADWPTWRGDGSGASHSGAEMIDLLDQAKFVWQSDPVGYSGCMHPGKTAGTGFCDPIVAGGRVYLYWFDRSGTQRVEWEIHNSSSTRGLKSLLGDGSEAYGRGCGYPKTAKEMADLQSHINADDVIVCFDDRNGKTLWKRVFHERGINHRKVYAPLCVPCVADGRLYGLGSAGCVYALDAVTGKTLWQSDVGRTYEEFEQWRELSLRTGVRAWDSDANQLNTALAIADGVVAMADGAYLSSKGNTGLVGFDAASGRRLWTVPNTIYKFGSPGVWRHGGKEYLLAAGDWLRMIESKTGRVLWEIGGPDNKITQCTVPAVSGDYVVVNKNIDKGSGRAGDRGPTCYRIGLTGAKQLWTLPIEDCPSLNISSPMIMRKHVYVPLKAGMACVELETGKILGKPIAGFTTPRQSCSGGDGLLFKIGGFSPGCPIGVAQAFPEMKVLNGALSGKADTGEIHAPAVANGRVYWRGKTSVWCYDFRKNPPPPSTAALPAARDLSGIKDNPAQLAATIEKEDWPTRAAAADLLRALGEKGKPAVEVLQKQLLLAIAAKDWGDTDLLLDTLLAIDATAAKPAAPELAKLLEASDARIRLLGFHGLRRMGDMASDAAPAVVKWLDAGNPEWAAVAAGTLGRMGAGAGAAVPALLKCLESANENLTFQAVKALCHLAPAEPAVRRTVIEAVLKHEWFIHEEATIIAPRFRSYKALALSLLGPEAIPLLLERTKKEFDPVQGKKGMTTNPNAKSLCDLASAALTIDRKTAPEFLAWLEKLPPPRGLSQLKLMLDDLKGTLDMRDPHGFLKPKADDKTKAQPEPKEEE
jgi:RNA polymerase sigma factor (sigma-70 family)